jgi:hypothetical protein
MRRARTVTFLVAWVFLLGLIQAIRAGLLLQRRDFLAEINLSLPLPYAIISAGIWAMLLGVAAVGVWRLRRWGIWLTLVGLTGSQAQAWLDRAWFGRADYVQLSSGFALATTLAVLAVTYGWLWWQRRAFIN